MARISRKQLKQDEFVEAASDAGHWLEHNWRLLVKWLAGVLLIAVIVTGWLLYSKSQRERTQELLGQSLTRYQKATDPAELEASVAEFDEILSRAGGSRSARVARLYRGAALLRLGRAGEAVSSLQATAEDPAAASTLNSTARVLLAEAYVALGRSAEAVALLTEMTEQPTPSFPPELALLRLGRLHEEAGDREQARRTWQRVVDEYPQTVAAQTARGLLEGEQDRSPGI